MKTILLLLLMTSVCWADIKFGKVTMITDDGRIINNKEYMEKTYKLSCPDGYKLEGKLFNKNKNTEPCPKLYTIEACIDYNSYTDAELKCVKDN